MRTYGWYGHTHRDDWQDRVAGTDEPLDGDFERAVRDFAEMAEIIVECAVAPVFAHAAAFAESAGDGFTRRRAREWGRGWRARHGKWKERWP
jgi:hypothetical protein